MTLHPCGSCPYRKDVPSGVWERHEYEKLPPYDNLSYLQPTSAFMCHQRDGSLCAGWVGCHDMDNSLGLRFAVALSAITLEQYQEALDYECSIPLWESGQEAHDYGVRDVDDPSDEACAVIETLDRKLS